MKSNKSKKEKSIDFEMEHLKEHLNTSFDINNIMVSEELFEKTLDAINTGTAPKITPSDANDYCKTSKVTPSDANDYDKTKKDLRDDTKKKNKFPIFKFAGAAAAVVILVIGINKIQDNLFMSKNASAPNSSMDLATEKSIADKADVVDNDANTASIAETNGSTATQSSEDVENKESSLEISQNNNMKENRVTSDVLEETEAERKEAKDAVNEESVIENGDTFDTTSENQATTDTASDSEPVMDNPIDYSLYSITQNASDSKSFAKQYNSTNYPIKVTDYIMLDNIYQISFYDQYAKDNINGTKEKKITKNADVIKEFYQLLNECTFTESDTISGNLYYKIVILSKNKEQSYTLKIKDGIQLIYKDKQHPENDYQINMQGSTEKIRNWIVKYLE